METVVNRAKINVTKHAYERWVERVLSVPKNEMNHYINSNKDILTENINETYQYAEFVYKGQLGTDNVTRHYYLHNNIVILTNTDNSAIITVYLVDYGLPNDLNVTMRKGLVEEIKRLSQEKEDIDFQVLNEVEQKKFEINTIDENIKILEQQINELKAQKQILNNDVKLLESKSKYVNQEINKYVLMLVNSIEFRKDLQTI